MQNPTYDFDTQIKKAPYIDGAYLEIPFDVQEVFGKGRIKARTTTDSASCDGLLVCMKTPCHIPGSQKDIRASIGRQPGVWVHITLQERQS